MTSAFIVRPFGVRDGIDFDRVERELLDPALAQLEIRGRTTGEILRAGNIRADMFQLLVTADLVLADVTIANANVFYELGIRHGLRDQRTFLLRGKPAPQTDAAAPAPDVPFDLRTDRYFAYDAQSPASGLAGLVKALEETLRSRRKDSPVYLLLSDLSAPDPSTLLVVPQEFLAEADLAARAKDRARLELLTYEVEGFPWQIQARRILGRALFDLKDWEGARLNWEGVLAESSGDLEASLFLGTVYQQCGDLKRSDQAIAQVLDSKGVTAQRRSEAYALRARNAKLGWVAEFDDKDPKKRRIRALKSPLLEESYRDYRAGFDQDLANFYPGINALAMLTILLELAKRHRDCWNARFESEAAARGELKRLLRERNSLETLVLESLRIAEKSEQTDAQKVWTRLTRADLKCLTSRAPGSVEHAYRAALNGASDQTVESVWRQLELYWSLELFEKNVAAALDVVSLEQQPSYRVLVFTGHRIDVDGDQPRFPEAMAGVARDAIAEAVRAEVTAAKRSHERLVGVAGGASGGDILFHEVCRELKVETELSLLLPPEQFCAASVQDAGVGWVERFWKLCKQTPPRVLQERKELPDWLQARPNYSIWDRNNLWILYQALSRGGEASFIALWDGKDKGKGPGGTADMIKLAKKRGVPVTVLDTVKLFGL